MPIEKKRAISLIFIVFTLYFVFEGVTWAYLPSNDVQSGNTYIVALDPTISAIALLTPHVTAYPSPQMESMGKILVVNSANYKGTILISSVSVTGPLGKYLQLYANDQNGNPVLIYAGDASGGTPISYPVDINLPIGEAGTTTGYANIGVSYKFVKSDQNQEDAVQGCIVKIGIIEHIGI